MVKRLRSTGNWANVGRQRTLGVAVTSYMASLSDVGPEWSNDGVWARHGYLIKFEELLISVGKELGMIEDELP